jgi:GNAT superfamily N-acetyltransferase
MFLRVGNEPDLCAFVRLRHVSSSAEPEPNASPSQITICKPEAADRAEWERLFRAYIAFYERALEDAEYERCWRGLLEDREIHAFLAKADGRVVGLTQFLTHADTNGPDVCYLQDLFTDSAARGRGVGRALIESVAAWARERGCSSVYWQTQVGNETARALYDQVAEYRGFIVYELGL